MGFEVSSHGKRELTAASKVHTVGHDGLAVYETGTVDVCAMFRRLVPRTLGSDVSPIRAVATMFMPAMHQFPNLKNLILCFDDPDRIPEVRHTFHAEKRYAKDEKPPKEGERRCDEDGRNYKESEYPVSGAEINELTMHHIPTAWVRFWNSKRGKAALWKVVESSIKHHLLHESWAPKAGLQYTLDQSDGRKWMYPARARACEMPPTNYGEGDTKCILWAAHFASQDPDRPVLVMTIDWDVVLALTQYDFKAHVWIWKAYVHKDVQVGSMLYDKSLLCLTAPSACKNWGKDNVRPVLEIVETSRLIRGHFEGDSKKSGTMTRVERQHYLMLSLCIEQGVDYNDGLKEFGFREKDMIALIRRNRLTSFPVRFFKNQFDRADPFRRTVVFYPGAFVSLIAPLWGQKRCKHLMMEAFNTEVHMTLFCFRYLSGMDSQRCPAGPPPPDTMVDLFPGVASIPELMARAVSFRGDPSTMFPPVTFTETHPYTRETIPYHASMTYAGAQLRCIQEAGDAMEEC